MDSLFPALAFGLVAFVISLGATRLVRDFLMRAAIFDHPNERSSHAVPTPRGGGLAVMGTILLLWGVLLWQQPDFAACSLLLLAAVLLLMLVSWWDDVQSLSPFTRLVAHAAAAFVAIAAIPPDVMIFQTYLPFAADRAIAFFGLIWFMNLYNFMDGIDGLTASQTIAVCVGLVVIGAFVGMGAALPMIVVGAAAGFLVFNWHPAKIFLGDVGSVPLGFVMGWLLLLAAAKGFWPAVIILPLYYLFDATFTLVRRLLRGEKIWLPHRNHFFQKAVQAGQTHCQVVWQVTAMNAVFIFLASQNIVNGWINLGLALVIVAAITRSWHTRFKQQVSP